MNLQTLYGNLYTRYILIGLLVILLISFILSIIKKAVKLAMFIGLIIAINLYGVNIVNQYNNELGISIHNRSISINNSYSSNVNFDLDNIKNISFDNSKSSDDKLGVTIELKDGSTTNFYVGSSYEKILRNILK